MPPNPQCQRSAIEHVRKFVAYAKLHVNSAWYYPPRNVYRYMMALALYSKCLTVAEATMVLLDADFSDEAFGMTRTLVDIFITLHYISNKDTEDRAQLYYRYFAKDLEGWNKIIKQFWPQSAQTIPPHMAKIAAHYAHPHRWSGKPVKDMALEPDIVEVDPATGKPMVHDFAYKVIYRWTSHYVHPTIVALDNHLVKPGHDNFVVRSRRRTDMTDTAAFNVAVFVANTMVCFYRCMGDPQPVRVGTWAGALMKHLALRHQ